MFYKTKRHHKAHSFSLGQKKKIKGHTWWIILYLVVVLIYTYILTAEMITVPQPLLCLGK